ncbi:MAG: glycoside hydrolase family 127 protein [Chloroflexi bacterium]|nr:glycoside hydrolase family 127 protein [Chloroflexota bacterium]
MVDTASSPFARWRSVRLTDVQIASGFWYSRREINRDISLMHGFRMLSEAGNLQDLRLAAHATDGDYRGPVFMDSDVYKWLEAVAYVSVDTIGAEVREAAEQAIALVQAAQQPDGYLDSYYQVVAPDRKWHELNTGHELYCLGHLIQAAVAWHTYVGDDRLLHVSQRVIEHVTSMFGPTRRIGVPGHPEVETALVELYRATRERAYLDLAQFFVDHRGSGLLGPNPRFGGSAYYQDRVPVREATEIEGHAVRALYLTAGVTDLFLECGEQALLDAMLRQWTDMVSHKLYLTGGAGSRHTGEAFGHAYELPTERAYCETCAAIGSIMWNWRLLLATGEARFADLIERTLYNGFLSGVSLAGDTFFYVNPLMSRGQPEVVGRGVVQRQPWFTVACCPPNVMRLLGSLGEYIASHDDAGVQIHQYISSTVRTPLATVRITTDYPWSGSITIGVEATTASSPWALQLRQPAWVSKCVVRLNSAEVEEPPSSQGYITLEREWHVGEVVELTLPIAPRLTVSHPRVESTRGCVAIERGPLVYCLEGSDNANVLDARLDPDSELAEVWQADVLGGITTIAARGTVSDTTEWGPTTFRPRESNLHASGVPTNLTAIPYFAWANRAPNPMRVWVPV